MHAASSPAHRRYGLAHDRAARLTAPKANRPQRDGAKIVMAIWAAIVFTFLFIPILLVIRHSFNRGGSFIVWSHHYSTRWWGALFNTHRTWNAIFVFVDHRRRGLVDRSSVGHQGRAHLVDPASGSCSVSSSIGAAHAPGYADLFNETGLGLGVAQLVHRRHRWHA